MDDGINWAEASRLSDVGKPAIIRSQPVVDTEVSKILGKPVLANDPRLIQLVVKWKKATASSADSDKMDNFMYNPEFLTELKRVFA